MLRRLAFFLRSLRGFFRYDLWDMEISALSGARRRLVRLARVLHLAGHGFKADDCRLHASALTFHTLMALVPMLALSLALARVFGGEAIARAHLRGAVESFTAEWRAETPDGAAPVDMDKPAGELAGRDAQAAADLADRLEALVDQAFLQVEQIDLKTLGGIGLIFLLWMVIGVIGKIEASFNRVWGVGSERSLWRKFTDYLSVLLILPFLLTAASSIPLFTLVARYTGESAAGFPGTELVRGLLVLLLTGAAFSFILIFLPNTKVRFWPGFLGGLVTALLFTGWLRVCAGLQVGVARYSRIYGSFATVPILLAWVFVSWAIILFGAELAYGLQNADSYRMEEGGRRASIRARLMLGVALVAESAGLMRTGHCLDASAFARQRRISARLLNQVLTDLCQAGLLAELADSKGQYLLRLDPGRLSAGTVIRRLLQNGAAPEAAGLGNLDDAVIELDREWFERIEQNMNQPVGDLALP